MEFKLNWNKRILISLPYVDDSRNSQESQSRGQGRKSCLLRQTGRWFQGFLGMGMQKVFVSEGTGTGLVFWGVFFVFSFYSSINPLHQIPDSLRSAVQHIDHGKMGSNPGKTHLPFIYPPGQHHKLTVMSPSEIISSFQYQIHENARDTLNKKWHFFLLPLTNSRFYLFRMHKAKGSAGAESPSAMGRRFVPGRAQDLGWVWAPWDGQGWQQSRGLILAWFWGKNPPGMKAQLILAVSEPRGSKIFNLELIPFSCLCGWVFNNKSSCQSCGYEKGGSIKSMGRNTSFCLC